MFGRGMMHAFHGNMAGMMGGGTFDQEFLCYPMFFFATEQDRDVAPLEQGDKIILPQSALTRLASLQISYPMLFKLRNPETGAFVHCGVLEFSAAEGYCYIPSWVLENLGLSERSVVNVINVSLPKGTGVTIQPYGEDFIKISNPRSVLELSLRRFSALTKGQNIRIVFNNKPYDIFISEVGSNDPIPDGGISIIETDVVLDFGPPLPKAGEAGPVFTPQIASGPFPVYPEDDPNPSSSSSEEEEGKPKKSKREHLAAPYVGAGFSLASGQTVGTPYEDLKKEVEEKEREKMQKLQSQEGGQVEGEEKKDSFEAFKGKGNVLKR